MNITSYIDYRAPKLYVTEYYLVEILGISLNTVRDGTRKFRKQQTTNWANFPYIKLDRKVLIDFDTIAFDRLKCKEIPDRKDLVNRWRSEKQKSRQDMTGGLIDSLDEIWMTHFQGTDELYYQNKFHVNQHPKDTKANHLAQSIAILRLISSVGNSPAQVQSATSFNTKKDLMVAVAQRVSELGLYGKGLNSYDRLRKSLSAFRKAVKSPDQDERDVVVSGHFGNTRRRKFDDLHKTVAMEYYLGNVNQQKPDKWAAYIDYRNFMMTEEGCSEDEVIRYSRFKQITLQKDIEVVAAKIRHGGSYYEAFVRPFVLRKELKHSLTLVAGDGWMPGRSVSWTRRNPKTGRIEKGVGGMNVWIWYDWKSKAIISHHIAPYENSHQIRTSFRDIIGFLGACPRSVMVDMKWVFSGNL